MSQGVCIGDGEAGRWARAINKCVKHSPESQRPKGLDTVKQQFSQGAIAIAYTVRSTRIDPIPVSIRSHHGLSLIGLSLANRANSFERAAFPFRLGAAVGHASSGAEPDCVPPGIDIIISSKPSSPITLVSYNFHPTSRHAQNPSCSTVTEIVWDQIQHHHECNRFDTLSSVESIRRRRRNVLNSLHRNVHFQLPSQLLGSA